MGERMTWAVVNPPLAGWGSSHFPQPLKEHPKVGTCWTATGLWPTALWTNKGVSLQHCLWYFVMHQWKTNTSPPSTSLFHLYPRAAGSEQVSAPSLWSFCSYCFFLGHCPLHFAWLNATGPLCLSLDMTLWKSFLNPRKQLYLFVFLAECYFIRKAQIRCHFL